MPPSVLPMTDPPLRGPTLTRRSETGKQAPQAGRRASRRIAALRISHCILDQGGQHVGEILYLALPLGTTHSWGVCGRYVTRELSRMAPVCLVTDRLEAGLVGDELELAA